MRAITTPLLCILSGALGAGCMSSGPNARQRAADETAARMIAVGSSGSEHARESGNVTAGAAASGATDRDLADIVAGPKSTDRARVKVDFATANRRYTVAEPPPLPAAKPRYLAPIRPAREAVWIDGYWAYTGDPETPYEWMSGHWEIPPPGAHSWVPSGWQAAEDEYVYVRGRWRL
jgi:hypothetical protein